MQKTTSERSVLRHRQVEVEGLSIHVVEGGSGGKPVLFFLHGWPESWAAHEQVMIPLGEDAHVVAIDLPGIGGSTTPPPSGDKRSLAGYARGVIEALKLREVTLVGHDVGGMIVYAYLRRYSGELRRAVIINVAIPGVDPWSEVVSNPAIWHFAFHAVPDLPERLVMGHQREYFDYFYNRLSASPDAVDERARATYAEAFSRREALRTGFEWYRAFPRDEKDNLAVKGESVETPVLYLRGGKDPNYGVEPYVNGLRESGLRNVQGDVIPESGHFAGDDQPDAVAAALRAFMGLAN